jgi:large subunit ribosomal protein L24
MIKPIYKIRLKKNDVIVVRSGKYKGQTGKITATHPRDNTVTVEGINIVKKHIKPNRQYPQGGIIEITKPIAVSKVGIIDPVTKKPVRIKYNLRQDGKKVRVYALSNKEIAP